eukprot:scaffold6388_cov403-Prasinococcus_capsulatus_cf.AAC.5
MAVSCRTAGPISPARSSRTRSSLPLRTAASTQDTLLKKQGYRATGPMARHLDLARTSCQSFHRVGAKDSDQRRDARPSEACTSDESPAIAIFLPGAEPQQYSGIACGR